MTMMNPDMAQYLGVFLDEAQEQLGLLETNVLQMERGDHSKEMLQVLFRAAHTLKGSSRAMGFLAVGDLTHEMENILDDLREDKLAVTNPIVNALLDCLDALNALIESVGVHSNDSDSGGKDIPALVARLDALRTGGGVIEEAPSASPNAEIPDTDVQEKLIITDYEQTAIHEAQATGIPIYHIKVDLHTECLMKSVRVFMVLGALGEIGTVLVASPNESELEDENFEHTFRLLFASEQPQEAIAAKLNSISEIHPVQIELWAPETAVTVKAAPVAETKTEAKPETKPVKAEAAKPEPKPAAAPVAAEKSAAPAAQAAVAHSPTIRVDIARLDNLLNLIGELVIDRTQIARIGSGLRERYPQDDFVGQLIETTGRVARVTGELQDEIMKTRMLPIDGVFQRLPRMVRDLAQKTGKEVDFQMEGGETELDRSVLEVLGDPLIHLLRNSVDHGIETPEVRKNAGKSPVGVVKLAARHQENHIVIEITDDGGGIDPVKIKAAAVNKGIITQAVADQMTDRDSLSLIFASGFSTAAVLSDISGRGVGMDIVKSNLEKLGGRIVIDSKVGQGSRFVIHLPLTLAIVRALLVKSGDGTYVLPLSSVVEMLRLGNDEVVPQTICGQAVIVLRGNTVPLASLADVLCGDPRATDPSHIPANAYVVVIGFGEKQFGLCVDALGGEQEVVIKSLGVLLGDIPGLSGATILGDGRVALIIDVAKAVECIHDAAINSASLAGARG